MLLYPVHGHVLSPPDRLESDLAEFSSSNLSTLAWALAGRPSAAPPGWN